MRIAILGGDARMPYAAAALQGLGHEVDISANGEAPLSPTALAGAEAVLLPLPLSRDGVHLNAPTARILTPLSALYRMLPEGVPLLCGYADDGMREAVGERRILEYGRDEGYLKRNAAITAEGAIALLAGRLKATIADTPCLILGAGRLAAALSDLLSGLHAPVTVLARRQDILLPGGHIPLPLSELLTSAGRFSVIINTVPAKLLTPDILKGITRGTLFLELSSAKGVVDADLLSRLGIELLLAPGLPGRYAPRSAGQAIADAVAPILSSH